MLAFVFPGQGSQARGMGGDLFDQVPEFADVERQIDQILGYSVRKLCLEDPHGHLQQTKYTQPALYIVNALSYYRALSEGLAPEALAGHSLGEYNALLAAGIFDFLTGLRLVQKRGELMGQARNGSMMAVLGMNPESILAVVRSEGVVGIDVANHNSPTQTVISGQAKALRRIAPILESAGAKMCVPLQVSAAFHSRMMVPAARAFGEFLKEFTFGFPTTILVSNVTAQPYPASGSGENLQALMARQIAAPVLWMQSVAYLMQNGISEFREVGPGSVLGRLIQQIRN